MPSAVRLRKPPQEHIAFPKRRRELAVNFYGVELLLGIVGGDSSAVWVEGQDKFRLGGPVGKQGVVRFLQNRCYFTDGLAALAVGEPALKNLPRLCGNRQNTVNAANPDGDGGLGTFAAGGIQGNRDFFACFRRFRRIRDGFAPRRSYGFIYMVTIGIQFRFCFLSIGISIGIGNLLPFSIHGNGVGLIDSLIDRMFRVRSDPAPAGRHGKRQCKGKKGCKVFFIWSSLQRNAVPDSQPLFPVGF